MELAEGDSEQELTAYLRRNPGMSHVAVEGTRLVGAVLAGYDGRRGLLYHLAVAPDRRGAGLGQALLARALAALKDAGVVRVLILVARDNAGGRTFWLRQGWEEIAGALPMGRDL